MLSLLHPELMTLLKDAGPGLWPLHSMSTGKRALAIKGGTDLIYAANAKKAFNFHLYRLEINQTRTVALMTAFYDRSNSPLVIQTVCYDENMRASLLDVLKSETLEIGFFDSHMSELLSGEWRITPSGDLDSYFDDCNAELDSNSVVDFYIALRQRFVNPNDNGLVVEVALQKINNPEKLSVIHITQDEVLSKRDEGLGIYESRLESTNSPGDSQEAEIARLLTKIYSPDSVFVNPSLENKGEFCDVLVIGNVDAVAIQAKSTIRSEARFSESKERRQSRLTKHFKTALKQARRSERLFYGLNKTVTFDGSLVGLTPRSTLLFHLIVLYEKDAELLEAWSEELASFSTENTPVVVLDFAEFVCMLNVYKSRDVFIAALLTLANSFQKRKKIQEYDFFRDRVAGFGQ